MFFNFPFFLINIFKDILFLSSLCLINYIKLFN
nr:MAG TPA: hypothetical protein [Caudoviricetes sp.]